MIVNILLLLSKILLITTFFLPHVSATPDKLENNTTGNETNLTNSTIPFLLKEGNNLTLINLTEFLNEDNIQYYQRYVEPEDFSFENRGIPKY